MVVFTYMTSTVLMYQPESMKLARPKVGSRCGEAPQRARMWGHCEGRHRDGKPSVLR